MLLDTASLYFRAFYGVPDTMRAPDRTPINAVRGLLDFIARLVNQHRPVALVACLDADWRPQFRVDALPSYKAHRVGVAGAGEDDSPPDLAVQVPIIMAVLEALGVTAVGVPGYEADDVIGTLAARATTPVDVVTSDRDLFQVIDDDRGVRVLYTARGIGNLQYVDAAVVREKYGVEPALYAALATLRGDPSDGLPGVPGIGEKTGATLLKAYGDLAGVRAAAADMRAHLTPGQRKNLRAASAYLDVAPGVVNVVTDLDIPADLQTALPTAPADDSALQALDERWGLSSSLARAREALYGG